MKKLIILIITIFTPFIVNASGGTLVQKSIKECSDGKIYGYHTKDGEKHYHEAIKGENGTYIASSKESLGTSNPCKDKIETTKEMLEFSECVDGDTAKFLLNGEKITVRFLAIDTPESVHPTKKEEPFGKEASVFTCEKITNAIKIEIEYDPSSDKLDKYDRYLGWIYVDDKLLQKELIEEGLAKIEYIYGDYLYLDELQEAENLAKQEKLKIWSDYKEEKVDYLMIVLSIIALTILDLIYKIIKKKLKKLKII